MINYFITNIFKKTEDISSSNEYIKLSRHQVINYLILFNYKLIFRICLVSTKKKKKTN